ncbi:Lrp/AsnC family transcriptional regulator [Aerobium aerolatum]|uniref:DNA-binding transcriptional regulator, Lrp family n=1 Tax=Aquamicrobium aerolatum DSM 21857 TaxID=1121003 RepID=A0A1I3I8I0_9HYPH|nr:Lrp/AsnC family transcriptional regulator [Aquamicrobium aerolatum]SFI44298.1 DNA-binding transcriptional regulator, Lrp family [Aquamicrobium aerolatum DSM 21857]
MDITEADKRLLRQLQRNSQISNQELAESVGMSASACWRRIKTFEENGVIVEYPAVLDTAKAGFQFEAIVHVSLARHELTPVEAFIEKVASRPEVVECFSTTGEADYHLRVVCRDKEAYNMFLEEFMFKLPGIAHVRTNLVLKVIKLTSQLPL